MKISILILLVTSFTKIESKITIDIHSDSVTYSGEEIKNVTQSELNSLQLGGYYITDSTQKVMSVKSATVKSVNKTPVMLLTQVFDNPSNFNITVDAGISYTVENTLTTTWSETDERFESHDVEVGISWYAVATVGLSRGHTATVGKNKQIADTVTIGSSSKVLVVLQPGESALAELSATKGDIEIEIIYKTFYRGYVKYWLENPNHEFSVNNNNNEPIFSTLSQYITEPIEVAVAKAHIINEKTSSQTIKLNFNTDGKVTVRNLRENNSTTAATLV